MRTNTAEILGAERRQLKRGYQYELVQETSPALPAQEDGKAVCPPACPKSAGDVQATKFEHPNEKEGGIHATLFEVAPEPT